MTLLQRVDELIEEHRYDPSHLIGILQNLQELEENKYLPKEALLHISKRLNVPLNRVYHIVTFFKAFSLTPKGKHILTCCLGTACHVKGGQRVVEKLERDLKMKPGETSRDLVFTLEVVNCVGACALAPVVIVDGEYHRQVTNLKVDRLLKKLRSEEK